MAKILSFQLLEDQYKALEKIAKEQDRSKGYLLRSMILNYIQDYKDIRNANKILKDIKSGKEKLLNWEDVKKDLYKK